MPDLAASDPCFILTRMDGQHAMKTPPESASAPVAAFDEEIVGARPALADWRGAAGAHWAGLTLLLAAALLYIVTLDDGLQPEELVGGDLITHQYAQAQARPSNAPGYPLYTVGGWLWFHGFRGVMRLMGNPLPNPIPILSSYSTLWALIALWLLYRILCRLTRSRGWPHGQWPLAWLLSAFFAVTYFFWYYATTTEQYSSAVAQTLAIIYVYLRWRSLLYQNQQTETGDGRLVTGDWTGASRSQSTAPPYQWTEATPKAALYTLFLLAFLCGLSLAHMLTVAFIVPPLVMVVLWDAPGLLRSWRAVVGAVLAAALPLVSYLYVYLRGAANPAWWGDGNWETPNQWFWAFVSTAQGREELGWGFEPGRAFFGNGFPELMWQELSLPLLLLGLVGIALLDRKLMTLLYTTLAIYVAFCWAYRYGNWYQVILPAYPLVLMGVAALAQRVQIVDWRRSIVKKQWILINTSQAGPRWVTVVVTLGLLVAIGWRAAASLPAADSRQRPGDTALDRAAQLIAEPLPPGALLFGELHDALALQYLIHIWQARPDLRVVSSPAAGDALAAGKAVFATWPSAAILSEELPDGLNPARQSAGPGWIHFQVGRFDPVVEPAVVAPQPITPEVTFYGFTMRPAGVAILAERVEPALDVTLFWQLDSDWPDDLAISVRPMQNGAFLPNPQHPGEIIQQDRARPAQGLLALDGLSPTTPLADAYRLPLLVDEVMVLLYRRTPTGFANVAELRLPTRGD